MNQRKSQIAIIVILSILLFGLAVFAWVSLRMNTRPVSGEN